MRPLENVRVVDVTVSLAGPYCTQLLGALGADVIKVERPGSGDETRAWGTAGESPLFLAANANKRSIAVDLSSQDGRDVVGVFGVATPRARAGARARVAEPEREPSLTPRQHEVLRLLADGASTEEVAAALGLSEETVRNHIRQLLRRLGVHSRLAAVAYARRHGLL